MDKRRFDQDELQLTSFRPNIFESKSLGGFLHMPCKYDCRVSMFRPSVYNHLVRTQLHLEDVAQVVEPKNRGQCDFLEHFGLLGSSSLLRWSRSLRIPSPWTSEWCLVTVNPRALIYSPGHHLDPRSESSALELRPFVRRVFRLPLPASFSLPFEVGSDVCRCESNIGCTAHQPVAVLFSIGGARWPLPCSRSRPISLTACRPIRLVEVQVQEAFSFTILRVNFLRR